MNRRNFNYLRNVSLRLFSFAVALASCSVAFAQDDFDDDIVIRKPAKQKQVVDKNPTIIVKGSVTDLASGQPIAGTRIKMLGNDRYTGMTNANGEFRIKVPTFATSLFVQAPRYQSQQVAIIPGDTTQVVRVQMINDKFEQMYADNTEITAKSSYNATDNGISIDEELGSVLGADVRTVMHSGNLEQGAAMFIRGLKSVNATSQPLVIVDGVELDMQRNRESLHNGDIFNMLSTISDQDIDKVTVVKNATALYGARGANGVILIETKRSKSQATRIDANISVGWTFIPSTPTLMNADQYRNYAVEQLGTVPQIVAAQASSANQMTFRFLNDDKGGYYYQKYHNDTNWKDEVYQTALTQKYGINVQGGDDIGSYNLSVAYLQTSKNIKKTAYDRVNVRFNTDINILYNVKTKFDISFSRSNTDLFDDGVQNNFYQTPIMSPSVLSYLKSPLLSPYTYNHNIHGFSNLLSDADDIFESVPNVTSLSNPTALIENGEGERKNRNENTFFNVTVTPTWQINKNLSASTHFSYYINRNSQAYYRPNIGISSFFIENLGTVNASVASIFSKESNVLSNTHIDWNNKYGAHSIAVTGGFRFNSFVFDDSNLTTEYKEKLPDDKNPQLSTGSNSYHGIVGSDDSWKSMQWYVSGDYNYMNKYFVQASLLAEANSRFGKSIDALKFAGVGWAIFPSLQFGWVLTNEKWFPKSSLLNYLKLTAGFDISGNDDISNYAAMTSFGSVRYNNTEVGLQMTNIGNDKIKWETTQKWNFGLQGNFMNNRLSARMDFFVHNTFDLLTLKAFDNPIGGINRYWTNDGKLTNKGIEVAFSGKPIVSKDWNLEVGVSVGHYSNEVKELTDGNYTSSIYGDNNVLTSVGNAVGVFYGYKTNGVIATTQEAKTAHKGVDYLKYKDESGLDQNFIAGDVKFCDTNGDGYIDDKDKQIIGNPNPDIYGNIFAKLTWKRFCLNLGFNYSIGNDIYNYQRSILNSGSTLFNQQVAETNHWRYEGQVTNIPRLAYGDPHGNNRFSDRWIENGSYLRLKTARVSYEIPVPTSWQGWLQGLSVWVEGRNLFTITQYTGEDPEVSVSNNHLYQGIDCGNIVQGRMFNMGVKINL